MNTAVGPAADPLASPFQSLDTPLLGRTEADQRARGAIEAAWRVAPRLAATRDENDAKAWLPTDLLDELRQAGLFSLTIPTRLGGLGLFQDQGYLPYFQVLEALASGDPSVAQVVQVHSGASYLVTSLGTPEQQQHFAHEVLKRGKRFASIGSEAPLGKKGPATYETVLRRVDGGWMLDSTKNFCSFAPAADYFVVWSLAPGPGPGSDRQVLSVVPRKGPGVELIDDWNTLGMRATMSWTIIFNRCFVPDAMMVGRPGWWKHDAPRVSFLLGPAANFLGTARGALAFTASYVAERPYLRQSQLVRVKLGEMSSTLAGARCAVYAAARLWEDEHVSPDSAELGSIRAFHLARQAVLDITSRCLDICGARATYKRFPLEADFRDARTYTLIHRDETFMELVGGALIGEPFSRHDEVDVAVRQG